MNSPVDITGVRLITPRLLLRPWRPDDLEDFYAYARVDGVGQPAGWPPHRSIEESRAILDRFVGRKKTFCLELQGRAVGSLGVEEYDEAVFPELAGLRGRMLGYVLAKDCWGRGLMPEAVSAAVRWLFDDAGLDFLTLGYYAFNRRSARVAEKCGFVPVKRDRQETMLGTVEDHVWTIRWSPAREHR